METIAVRRVSIPLAHRSAVHPTDNRPCVLLVTDDADLRAVARRVLERAGYDLIAVAHSGHALLACLTARRVDALATELSMEDTSGPALAERLRRHHPGLATVFFGRAGTPECQGVLVRPFTRDDLLDRLEVAIAARVVSSAV